MLTPVLTTALSAALTAALSCQLHLQLRYAYSCLPSCTADGDALLALGERDLREALEIKAFGKVREC